jgi:hypothetical protein
MCLKIKKAWKEGVGRVECIETTSCDKQRTDLNESLKKKK